MPFAYQFANPDGTYFVTFATVQWADAFTRKEYVDILLDSLRFCHAKKGLRLHAWCIMSNHVHLIISRAGTPTLSDILRDLKKYTVVRILEAIQKSETRESRKGWMLWLFRSAGEKNPNNEHYQFWQQENHPEELLTPAFLQQKMNYIHRNPVMAGLVDEPWEYRLSSARDYMMDRKGLLAIDFV